MKKEVKKVIKPIVILKPDIVNGMFPLFMTNFFKSLIPVVILYFGYLIVNYFFGFETRIYRLLIFALLLFSMLPITYKIILLYFTRYSFFRDHMTRETHFISITRDSVPYFQITNIEMVISLWDRFCNAGDIIIYTPEQHSNRLVLQYVKDPQKIEGFLYDLIMKNKNKA